MLSVERWWECLSLEEKKVAFKLFEDCPPRERLLIAARQASTVFQEDPDMLRRGSEGKITMTKNLQDDETWTIGFHDSEIGYLGKIRLQRGE